MNHVPARRNRRLLATAGTLALISVLAVGCGDDGDDAEAQETETVVVDPDGNVIEDGTDDTGDDTGDDPTESDVVDDSGPALTQDQIEAVVLTQDNVGDGWSGGPVESDDESGAPGCFADIDAISDGLDPIEVAEHDVSYGYGEEGLPTVSSGASSYEDGNAVAQAFVDLDAALGACTSIADTDAEGNQWDLTVSYDSTELTDTIDDQLNVTASGTFVDTSGTEYDVTLHQSYVRIGKNVITVGVTDLVDQPALQTGYTQIAIDRLVAVIIDSEPSETTGPQPA